MLGELLASPDVSPPPLTPLSAPWQHQQHTNKKQQSLLPGPLQGFGVSDVGREDVERSTLLYKPGNSIRGAIYTVSCHLAYKPK